MSKAWSLVRLDKILQLQRRWLMLNPTEMYTEIGIRSFGKGIFHKTPVLGASLGNKRVLQIQPGDIVFSNVFAWEGAVAVAGEAEAGKIGSHRFVTYTTIGDQCSVEYLRLFFCSQPGLEVLRRVSPGSAGRNRTLNIAQFAKQEIPLPPLKEQLRIVARVEELAGKIEEARSLRQKALKETEALIGAFQQNFFLAKPNSIALGEIATVIDPNPSHRYPTYCNDGIPIISTVDFVGDDEISTKHAKYVPLSFYEDTIGKFGVEEGDIIFSRKGKVGYARLHPPNIKLAMTHTLCVIQPDRNKVLPRYLLHFTRSPAFIGYLTGTMNPNVGVPTLGLGVIRSAPFNLPPLLEQRCIVAYLGNLQAKVDEMKRLREQALKELDAMLPSILDKAFKGEL
jgi:type I restriction enzyme S subunit